MTYIRFENAVALLAGWNGKILLPKFFVNLNITIRSLFHSKAFVWPSISMVQIFNCFCPLVYVTMFQKLDSAEKAKIRRNFCSLIVWDKSSNYYIKGLIKWSINKGWSNFYPFKMAIMTWVIFSNFQLKDHILDACDQKW